MPQINSLKGAESKKLMSKLPKDVNFTVNRTVAIVRGSHSFVWSVTVWGLGKYSDLEVNSGFHEHLHEAARATRKTFFKECRIRRKELSRNKWK